MTATQDGCASSTRPASDATWAAFEQLVSLITGKPVRYGPGRGLWNDGRFTITYGPGMLGGGVKSWPNALGKAYPSFHCTSWVNFFLGWLLRRNELYTHGGNIPSLFDLCESDASIHRIVGGGLYRGYSESMSPVAPDGSALKRSGVPRVVDMRELYDRRAELPTFVVAGQSDKRKDGTWNWWHHVVLFVFRDGRMFRIAADGYKGQRGYSADPMRWVEITEQNVSKYAACVYRCYAVVPNDDGTYGDLSKPIATVDFE